MSTSTSKKPTRELSSITNHLLLTKTLNSLVNDSQTSTIKENMSKSTDNTVNLLNICHLLSNNNLNQLSSVTDTSSSSSFVNHNQFKEKPATKSSSSESTSMIYLCRFYQRNRLIEVPFTSEQQGISHDNLKNLIIQEFHLNQISKTKLIVQIWNDQYQDYIDIESFKQIPPEGRLQVFIEKDINSTENSANSKSPSTLISSQTITTTAVATGRSTTPNPIQTTTDVVSTPSVFNRSTHIHDEVDCSPQVNHKNDHDSLNNSSISQLYDQPCHNLMYDLLPKPTDGIPIPRFPPHIAAFLNGNGDANQLNAVVQVLYQEIVKYELYPNADELRSIVSRLVDRYPQCTSVIGSIELLVRKLYYKFCNERKKYPMELKRRQPNKRKRLTREEDLGTNISNNQTLCSSEERRENDSNQVWLDYLKHMWTASTTDEKDNLQQQQHSASSSTSSSPVSSNVEQTQKYHPVNLSISMNNNLLCTE
ncbi:unnamed protein product [Adineta ricciae]|uniref:Uncharacterized protein n=1 Tax=Adineta ricciae TaxID=249248 RepID=A0A814I6M4_ADIRI|nr:unnamed protein product [Adineta ricciae]CAF1318207.1 unnamed protein product [Adineta ricciae]